MTCRRAFYILSGVNLRTHVHDVCMIELEPFLVRNGHADILRIKAHDALEGLAIQCTCEHCVCREFVWEVPDCVLLKYVVFLGHSLSIFIVYTPVTEEMLRCLRRILKILQVSLDILPDRGKGGVKLVRRSYGKIFLLDCNLNHIGRSVLEIKVKVYT